MSSELTPRPSGRPSRRAREQRAFRLVVAGGAASLVAVVGLVLAIAGVVGGWLPVLAIVVAVVCLVLFRRTVGS
jgi:CHASE2 domain-containing sensor protein